MKLPGWLNRASKPPTIADLAPEERIVSWADTADSTVVATTHGIWWPEQGGQHRRIGWHRISKATWRDGTLSVIEADLVDDLLLVDRPAVHATLTVVRDLPPTVRKRVEANIVHTEQVAIGGGTASLVGRRVPGEDGVRWWARLENGAVDDGQVRFAISSRLARLQADWEARHAQV